MPGVGRVVTAADGSEVADTAVEIEDGSGVGLKRSGQKSGQVEMVHAEVDGLVQLDGAGRAVDVDEPGKTSTNVRRIEVACSIMLWVKSHQ